MFRGSGGSLLAGGTGVPATSAAKRAEEHAGRRCVAAGAYASEAGSTPLLLGGAQGGGRARSIPMAIPLPCRPAGGATEPPAVYVIRVAGRVDPMWVAGAPGLRLTASPDGATTELVGRFADQEALLGVLRALHRAGAPLLAVTRRDPAAPVPP